MRMSRAGEMVGRSAERTPFGWAAVAAALAMTVSTTAIAQAQATAPAPPTAQNENVFLEADELIDDQATRTITAQGDVQVRYQGRTMRADSLVYNLENGEIHAVGDADHADDGSVTYVKKLADEAMNVSAAHECAHASAQHTCRAPVVAAKAKTNYATSSTPAARSARPIARRPGCAPVALSKSRRARSVSALCSSCFQFLSAVQAHRIKRDARLLCRPDCRNQRLGTFYAQPYIAISTVTITARCFARQR